MPVQPSPTQWYAKALVLALLASSAATESIREGGMHSSPASNAPVTITRSLRSSVTMKTSYNTNKLQGRNLGLFSLVEKWFAGDSLEEKVMKFHQESSNKWFTDLELEKIKANQLSENVDRLEQWLLEVYKAYLKGPQLKDQDLEMSEKDASHALFKALSGHYEGHDLATALLAATSSSNPIIRSIIPHMKEAQFQTWENDKKTVDGVFTFLKLDKLETGELIESPFFSLWIGFVKAANSESKVAVLDAMGTTLSSHYDDAALLDIFVDAQNQELKNDGLPHLASAVEKILVEKWSTDRKTPEDVFVILKDKEKNELFQSPLMTLWARFVLSSHSEETAYKTMYTTLKAHFNDYELATIFLDSNLSEFCKGMVNKLKRVQYSKWNADELDVDRMYTLLEILQNGKYEGDRSHISDIVSDYVVYLRELIGKRKREGAVVVEDSPP